ncbi:hypothetical protein EJB05_30599, partial [Eragrostis curvula]
MLRRNPMNMRSPYGAFCCWFGLKTCYACDAYALFSSGGDPEKVAVVEAYICSCVPKVKVDQFIFSISLASVVSNFSRALGGDDLLFVIYAGLYYEISGLVITLASLAFVHCRVGLDSRGDRKLYV